MILINKQSRTGDEDENHIKFFYIKNVEFFVFEQQQNIFYNKIEPKELIRTVTCEDFQNFRLSKILYK